ncbi:MFS transporter [Sodalinema gerasimenkoae]|uniref:MFS transporter n=1 Tax=Sodalinema gerasimenkoae TaxID=2862348 RepID=UPI00135745C2|nr:MFS transporter [Sodalinema gerasimenkoae]
MQVFKTLNPEKRRNLSLLFTGGLFFWASMASLLPTLPLYVQDLGGTQQQIGWVMGSFAIGLLISRPTLGRWADRRSRVLVLRVGTAVVAIAPLGYLFAASIPQLMLLRTFHGISIAAFTTAYSALVADISPPDKRGELIGYMSLVTPMGLAIGPALGGFVQQGLGYVPLFLMTAGLGLVSCVCSGFLDNTPSPHRTQGGPSPTSERFWVMLTSPRIQIPATLMFIVGLIFGTITTFVPLYIQDTGVNFNPGLFYTMTAISSFTMRLVTGRASDRWGRGLFISGALICYFLAMVLLWQADRPALFALAGLIEGMAAGTMLPTTIALITDRSQAAERGRVFSICVGGFDLGIAIAGPLLGTFAEDLGYAQLFAIAASLSAIAFLLFITRNSKDLSHSFRFALGRERDIYALEHLG